MAGDVHRRSRWRRSSKLCGGAGQGGGVLSGGDRQGAGLQVYRVTKLTADGEFNIQLAVNNNQQAVN